MANKFFSKIQFGKESTRGTAVAADTLVMGAQMSALSKDRNPQTVPEDIGIRMAGIRKAVDQYLVTDTLSIQRGYFQILPMLFGCALKGGVTPSEVTPAQADYLWDFTPSLASGVSNAPDSVTMEKGDDTQAYEAEYGMFGRIKLSGQVAQGAELASVGIEAEFFARRWTATTFTGSIAIPTVNDLNAKLSRAYLDSAWAGVGGTELAGLLRGFELDIVTGLKPAFSGSGDKFFTGYKEGLIGAMLTLDLERGATTDAQWDAFMTDIQTLKVMQLKLSGPQIGTGAYHTAIFNVGGQYAEVIPMSSEDRGNHIDRIILDGLYDGTGAKGLEVKITTNVAAY